MAAPGSQSQAKLNPHGMDREIWDRINAKFDPVRAQSALQWIYAVTQEDPSEFGDDFGTALRNGYLIAKLILTIDPTVKAKIKKKRWKAKKTNMSFPAREQIEIFGKACKALGMRQTDVFTSQDLYEGENLNNVVNTLYSLNALAQNFDGFNGPYIDGGFALAQENRREFTEEQIRAGRNIVPRWNTGSIQVESGPRLDSSGIVKTAGNEDWVANNSVPAWNRGGVKVATQPRLDSMGILKTAGSEDWVASSDVPRMNRGTINHSSQGLDSYGVNMNVRINK